MVARMRDDKKIERGFGTGNCVAVVLGNIVIGRREFVSAGLCCGLRGWGVMGESWE